MLLEMSLLIKEMERLSQRMSVLETNQTVLVSGLNTSLFASQQANRARVDSVEHKKADTQPSCHFC